MTSRHSRSRAGEDKDRRRGRETSPPKPVNLDSSSARPSTRRESAAPAPRSAVENRKAQDERKGREANEAKVRAEDKNREGDKAWSKRERELKETEKLRSGTVGLDASRSNWKTEARTKPAALDTTRPSHRRPARLDTVAGPSNYTMKTAYTNSYDQTMALKQTRIEKLAPAERKEQEMWAQEQIKHAGSCIAGYDWLRIHGGYRCHGGNHVITDELISTGEGKFYTTQNVMHHFTGRKVPSSVSRQWTEDYDANQRAGSASFLTFVNQWKPWFGPMHVDEIDKIALELFGMNIGQTQRHPLSHHGSTHHQLLAPHRQPGPFSHQHPGSRLPGFPFRPGGSGGQVRRY